MKKRDGFLGLVLMASMVWLYADPPPSTPVNPHAKEKVKPKLDWTSLTTASPAHTSSSLDAKEEALIEALMTERIHVRLSPTPALEQSAVVFHAFKPRQFIPELDLELLPESETADALASLMDADHAEYADAIDDFLDAVEDDPELDGFDANWVDIIDLETERLMVDVEFEATEAEVFDLLNEANHRSPEEGMAMTEDLPPSHKDNSHLIDLAQEIIDEDPLHPVADLARLYAAHAMSDPASGRPNEGTATQIILDTIANSETIGTQTQAVQLLLDTAPQSLSRDDLDLLENAWHTLDTDDQTQLSRFLTQQHFTRGNFADAEVWTDRFEAEVLSEENWTEADNLFLREIEHNRARIGARMGSQPRDWRTAVVQRTWQCWEGPDGLDVMAQDYRLRITGDWTDGIDLHAKPADHPLAGCILSALASEPTSQAPLKLNLVISITGLRSHD